MSTDGSTAEEANPQYRYLVHCESSTGPRYPRFASTASWTKPWQAQNEARGYLAEQAGRTARVMRVGVDEDGAPVAEWMDWPDHGLFRVYWKSGGTSLAAVGITADGGRWLAPINWTAPSCPFQEWDHIDHLERVVEGFE